MGYRPVQHRYERKNLIKKARARKRIWLDWLTYNATERWARCDTRDTQFSKTGMLYCFPLVKCWHRIMRQVTVLSFQILTYMSFIFFLFYSMPNNFHSSVGVAMGLTAGVRILAGARFYSSPQRPDRLWGPASLLWMGTGGVFPKD
jgi:hypothetical protein